MTIVTSDNYNTNIIIVEENQEVTVNQNITFFTKALVAIITIIYNHGW